MDTTDDLTRSGGVTVTRTQHYIEHRGNAIADLLMDQLKRYAAGIVNDADNFTTPADFDDVLARLGAVVITSLAAKLDYSDGIVDQLNETLASLVWPAGEYI